MYIESSVIDNHRLA